MFNAYLTFDGNTREAFEFYKSVFGGEYSAFQTYGNAPADMNVPDEHRDKVMHVSLPVGDSVLMASDHVAGFGAPLTVGNNFSISVVVSSRQECDDLFAKLSDGGIVAMPLQETFWNAYVGSWTDKFGINWMVNYDLSQE